MTTGAKAASEIGRKQGKLDKMKELQASLAEAQANAKEALAKKQ